MFEDSLLESSGKFKSGRTKYTTFLSFLIQIALVGVLVLIPLIYTEALPKQMMTTFLVAPPPPPPPPPPPAAVPVVKAVRVETEIVQGQLRQPTKIPEKVKIIDEQEAPAPMGAVMGVAGGIGDPGGAVGGVLGSILTQTSKAIAAVPKVETPQKVRVSQGVAAGNLVRDVKPSYPPLARQARVQGAVVLLAVISKDGSIQNLRVASGHPMLVQAALDAVKQWHYKPYFLNGEPVEVETQITVNFTLSGG
ncbi:MAG TPA: energy transducer TonB [Terriglobales bacterium]|nr:energy transducer TonB [Terriglobales bacterium]